MGAGGSQGLLQGRRQQQGWDKWEGCASCCASATVPCPVPQSRLAPTGTSVSPRVSLQENNSLPLASLSRGTRAGALPARPYALPCFTARSASLSRPGRPTLSWKAQPFFLAIAIVLMKCITLPYKPVPFVTPVHHGSSEDAGGGVWNQSFPKQLLPPAWLWLSPRQPFVPISSHTDITSSRVPHNGDTWQAPGTPNTSLAHIQIFRKMGP